MKTIYRTFQLCFFAVVLTLNSCTDENIFGISEEGAYKSTLIFNVVQAQTRTTGSEDDVRKLEILIFKDNILEKVMKNVTSFVNSPEGYSSVNIYFDTEGTRKAYIVANNDNESWLDALQIGKTTVDDIKKFRTATLRSMAVSPFVMYGISDDIHISSVQNSVLCNLHRTVAKIEVNNKADNFELAAARLINPKVASGLFPGSITTEIGTTDFMKTPGKDGYVSLYTYENNALKTKDATAVEIEGEVNGAQLKDTIYFAIGEKLLPLERNYRYTININDVKKHTVVTVMDVTPWNIGDDIDETFSSNKPTVTVKVEETIGNYSKADSTLTIIGNGGEFTIDIQSNAECDTEISDEWLKNISNTRTVSFIGSNVRIKTEPNESSVERTGKIKIINKLNKRSQTIIVRQAPKKVVIDKYMVLVVAGQSNAVGYDQSPIDAEDLNTPERALQLSYRNGPSGRENLSVIPLSWCADDIDAYKRSGRNESGQYGLKGIHLPLVKEIMKYIPADYNIVVVPVAYASSKFAAGHEYGTYNTAKLRPNEITSPLRWGEQSPYRRTLIDRVNYLLDLNYKAKFLGIVWCQGENDYANSDYHYTEFTKMAEGILSDLSDAGYDNRSNYGKIDKRSWYTYSSCSYWVNWYSQEDASAVFGGYKVWNPDTFIHAPSNLPVNAEGGIGMGKYHFGKNSFRQIARMIAERMNQNGLLFNETVVQKDYFKDKTTYTQAMAQGGSINDSDVRDPLLLYLPLNTSATEKIGDAVVFQSNVSLVNAEGLKDINGETRRRNALSITPQGRYIRVRGISSVQNWTLAFMFKRTGNFTAETQSIMCNPDVANVPFVGFRKYSSGIGVAKAAEFVIEPIRSGIKNKAVPGQFMAADNVYALDEWIHYLITYDSVTKKTSIYMNGDLVQTKIINNTQQVDFSTIYIGNASSRFPSAEGLLMDFGLWNKVLDPQTIRKVFLMSYYGYTK